MLIVWFMVWIVLGLIVGVLASVLTKSEPPYGIAVDVIASVLAMVIVGLGDYYALYILHLFGIEGVLAFIATILEPLASAVIVLWLLRFIKRRRQG